MTPGSPARLHVLFGREVSTAVVIRRGPAKRVATFAWDRSNDTFSEGQWLHGRIYERRLGSVAGRPPKGHYWLNDGYGHKALCDTREVVRDTVYRPPPVGNSECLGVYFPRLLRDGWKLVSQQGRRTNQEVAVFEKALSGSWILRKFARATTRPPIGRNPYYDEHELVRSTSAEPLPFPDWEWADFDLDRDRLVWAERGKLFAGKLRAEGLVNVRELRDFNADTYRPIRAPY